MSRISNLPSTPLQKVVGFDVAEEIYDQLPLVSQIIIDMRIAGFTMHEIAGVVGRPYTTVYDELVRSRYHLAKLKATLEIRQHYRETHPLVAEQGDGDDL